MMYNDAVRSVETENKPLVSIIVTAFNVEELIQRAIQSVMFQTYENIEIIVIDDGSTDATLSRCRYLERVDTRITVICLNNSGPGNARNEGIKFSSGQYVMFLDGDDYYKTNKLIQKVVNVANECNADWVAFNYIVESEKGVHSVKKTSNGVVGMYAGVWNKLYSKELIDKERLPTGVVFEDIIYSLKIYLHAKNRAWTNVCGYSYWQRENSAVRSDDYEKHWEPLELIESYLDDINYSCNEDVQIYLNRHLFNHLFVGLYKAKIVHKKSVDKKQIARNANVVKKLGSKFSKNLFVSNLYNVCFVFVSNTAHLRLSIPVLWMINFIRKKRTRPVF